MYVITELFLQIINEMSMATILEYFNIFGGRYEKNYYNYHDTNIISFSMY